MGHNVSVRGPVPAPLLPWPGFSTWCVVIVKRAPCALDGLQLRHAVALQIQSIDTLVAIARL